MAELLSYFKAVPPDTLQSINRYVRFGEPVGGFLTAVLENNLVQSFNRADERNIAAMFDIVSYLYNHCPLDCYGSPAKVEAWYKQHRDAREARR